MKKFLTGSKRIEYIDFVRGIAILFMILQLHTLKLAAKASSTREISGL